MATTTKYQINVSLQDNVVTANDKDDKIFVVVSQGTADQDRLVEEIMGVNPGLEPETVRMVMDLFNRIVMKLLLQGMRVNTGLFNISLGCKGVTYDGTWDPNVNSLQINISPSQELRSILDSTTIHITGESRSPISLSGGESALGAGFRVKAGRAFTLYGRHIKVLGEDPSVGITLTDAEGEVTKIEGDMIIQNDPSKLVFLVPSTLADGEYDLKVITQYSGTNRPLKNPRSVSRTLIIGETVDDDSPTVDEGEEGGSDGPSIS